MVSIQIKRRKPNHGVIAFSLTFLFVLGPLTAAIAPVITASENIRIHEVENTRDFVLTDDPAVVILSDQDFIDQGWEGGGIPGNPYRIEDLNITSGGTIARIEIRNTRAHFIIENCTLSGFSGDYAIYFLNVSNAEVTENICFDNDRSIAINNSTDIIISDNICNQTQTAISVWSNYANHPATRIEIRNNTCRGGQNAMQGYGVKELTAAENRFYDTAWGIAFDDSEQLVFEHNLLSNFGYRGFDMDNIDDLVVHNNTILDCGRGIRLYLNNWANLTNNTIDGCEYGMHIMDSDWNTIENNTFSNCDYGVFIFGGCVKNQVIWNFFESNTDHCMDNGTSSNIRNNYWDTYAGSDGNGDGIGDTPNPLTGTSENEDPYPLMSKVVDRLPIAWDPTPINQFHEYGSVFRYDLNTTFSGHIDWTLTSPYNLYNISSNGVVTNRTLNPATLTHEMHVIAMNIYARSVSADFNITVQDTTAPIWLEEPQDAFWELGQVFYIELDVWDLSMESISGTWWMNDTEHFYWQEPTIYGNMSTVTLREYGLEIRISDYSGNYVSAEITVTVRDSIKPVFTMAPDEEMTIVESVGSIEGLIFEASDLNPASYQILYNGVEIKSGLWNSSLDQIELTIQLQDLAVGTHTWTVIVTDIAGNTESQSLTIIVEAEPTTSTTTTPPPSPIPMEVIAIAIGGIVVILLIIVVLKRRG